jgi:hypothetical protein
MNKLVLMAAVSLAALATPAVAQEESFSCLITFGSVEDAEAGADATALSGVYLPTADAEAEAAGSGGLAVVFDYTDQGYPTNAEEQAFCEGPTFNPDDDDGNGAANPNSAKAFAPGQLKKEGESARSLAPGQLKEDGESAKESAPGQAKKAD